MGMLEYKPENVSFHSRGKRKKNYTFSKKESDMIKALFVGDHEHRRWAQGKTGTWVMRQEQHLPVQVSSPRDHYVIFISV